MSGTIKVFVSDTARSRPLGQVSYHPFLSGMGLGLRMEDLL